MILQIEIKHDDVVKMLINLGFDVRFIDKPVTFPTFNGRCITEIVQVWVIKNPKTGVDELLTKFVDNYVKMKSNKIFLHSSEDEIMSLFKSES